MTLTLKVLIPIILLDFTHHHSKRLQNIQWFMITEQTVISRCLTLVVTLILKVAIEAFFWRDTQLRIIVWFPAVEPGSDDIAWMVRSVSFFFFLLCFLFPLLF